MSNRLKSIPLILLASWLIFAFVSLLFSPATTQAQGSPLPTATPLGTPPPDEYQAPPGGTIILQVYNAPADAWTVVQWQDANGDWHNVEGWQSDVTTGYVGWWVAPANFASGPFRWLLQSATQEEAAAISDSFYLPDHINDVVLIELSGNISQ